MDTIIGFDVPAFDPSFTQWSKDHPKAGFAVTLTLIPKLYLCVPTLGFVDPDPIGDWMFKE